VDPAIIHIGDQVRVNLTSDEVRRAFPNYDERTRGCYHGRVGTVTGRHGGEWSIRFADVERRFLAIELEPVRT
jgi:hypothetical protein